MLIRGKKQSVKIRGKKNKSVPMRDGGMGRGERKDVIQSFRAEWIKPAEEAQ